MDRKWWTLIAVCTGVFMLLLDITIVNVALPQIETAFKASLSDLQWVIDAYALTLAALLLTAGSIADLAGRRRVFAAGIVVFTLGSILCGAAPSSLFLSLARSLQGVGGAIMFATALALLAQAFPPRERGVAFAAFGAVTGVAVAVGPVIGGAITSGLTWRWIFFVNVPIGIAALAITLRKVDESRLPHAPRPDFPGFISFSLALAGLVFGLIRSQAAGWGSFQVLGSLIAAAVLMLAFLAIEMRSREPMLDLSLLRVPTFNGGLVAAWAVSASIFSMLTYLVIYFQDLLGYSAIGAGLRFLPLTGAVFLIAGIAGRLTTKVQIRYLIGVGFAFVVAGMMLMRGLTPTDSWTHFLPGFILAGIGAGFINVPLASTAVGVVPAERAGMASGINSTLRQVGIATGVAALGTILTSRIRSEVVAHLAHTSLAAQSHALGTMIGAGGINQAVRHASPQMRGLILVAAKSSFVDALNTILLVGAGVALVGMIVALLAIRQRDFHDAPGEAPGAAPSEQAQPLAALAGGH
ncbi:MAG TPA: DHA2 family efflux MFS transporter permease subunit [Solirubrobacteraceae bacterium]|nr:DHA2 family efflux MFS transporter permease subunit [Solirubrobacteraceae bacterium]